MYQTWRINPFLPMLDSKIHWWKYWRCWPYWWLKIPGWNYFHRLLALKMQNWIANSTLYQSSVICLASSSWAGEAKLNKTKTPPTPNNKTNNNQPNNKKKANGMLLRIKLLSFWCFQLWAFSGYRTVNWIIASIFMSLPLCIGLCMVSGILRILISQGG